MFHYSCLKINATFNLQLSTFGPWFSPFPHKFRVLPLVTHFFLLYCICSTPFELHDDNYVLKAMKFCERPQSDDMAPNPPADGGEGSSMSSMYQPQILASPSTNTPVRHPTSPPLPGIIKARVKNEH